MKTRLLFFSIAVSAAMPALAKVKYFTLKELADTADAIVVATMASEDGESLAEIQRTIKGTVGEESVKVWMDFEWMHNAVEFTDGERVVLFLNPADPDGRRKLRGSDDQGKWPKTQANWRYTVAYTSSLERVEAVVAELVRVRDRKAEAEAFVKDLLNSKLAFDQVIALECLVEPEFVELREELAAAIDTFAESPDPAFKRSAGGVKWQMKQDALRKEFEARRQEILSRQREK